KLRIYDPIFSMLDVFHLQWIHVMNHQFGIDFVTRNPEVTSIVTSYDLISNVLPFLRLVKTLVNPSIEAKGHETKNSLQLEIPEALFECVQLPQLGIRSILHPELAHPLHKTS